MLVMLGAIKESLVYLIKKVCQHPLLQQNKFIKQEKKVEFFGIKKIQIIYIILLTISQFNSLFPHHYGPRESTSKHIAIN